MRRRIPQILAYTSSQRAVDGLIERAGTTHAFEIRFHCSRAMEFLHRMADGLRFDRSCDRWRRWSPDSHSSRAIWEGGAAGPGGGVGQPVLVSRRGAAGAGGQIAGAPFQPAGRNAAGRALEGGVPRPPRRGPDAARAGVGVPRSCILTRGGDWWRRGCGSGRWTPAATPQKRIRRCTRDSRVTAKSQTSVKPTLIQAKPEKARWSCAPSHTTPACRTSPKRMKNVSIAAFALYLASREVGGRAPDGRCSGASSRWRSRRSWPSGPGRGWGPGPTSGVTQERDHRAERTAPRGRRPAEGGARRRTSGAGTRAD